MQLDQIKKIKRKKGQIVDSREIKKFYILRVYIYTQ